MVAIHDAQRPLTRSTQFHRTLEGLFGCDAVRPTMAFTETLKSVNQNSELTHTIDRTKVRRVSSPEIIRRSVIDFDGTESTWALPLSKDARLSEVEADPDSLRINSEDEVVLLEAFMYWQQKVVN
jgi:2-C-methyl-D-erythritol 4-phosphate cytidylyltransferase